MRFRKFVKVIELKFVQLAAYILMLKGRTKGDVRKVFQLERLQMKDLEQREEILNGFIGKFTLIELLR